MTIILDNCSLNTCFEIHSKTDKNSKMVKSKRENSSFGYIYQATNVQNGKNYMGQTVTSRWGDDKNPIEERWKEEVRESYARQRREENLRYIENAIIKYGAENFILKEVDVAHNQEELDKKETYYIKEYDTMNPDKGYNMKEGGRGGRLSEMAKENLSKIGKEKWQNNLEYAEKQIKERKERGQDPKFREKMTKINRERAQKPEYRENMRKIMKEKIKDPGWRENVSKGVSKKYQKDPEYSKKQAEERRERAKNPEWVKKMTDINRVRAKDPKWLAKMRDINSQYRKEIADKKQFLNDIQNMQKL